ncbi:grhN [Nocardia asteroides]|uniref:grhN n=1 Tax=Nocardia asteroides TaxID=1824 RepID=UPI001E335935|nr:grhN [Nocardia asteroides]UGT62807.1 grhN [Nocardia asteroides]
MTVTTTGVRLAPPPPALMRVVNPLVRRVLANRRLGRRIPLQALLEFTGRRSGRRLRVPVCLHSVDGVPTVFTERPWRLNFTEPAPVVVTQRGRVRTGHAVLLHVGPVERGRAMRQALDNGATPFELGLKVGRGHTPTADELSAIARSLIRVDFPEE